MVEDDNQSERSVPEILKGNDGKLVVPVPEGDFAKFFAGLLGKRQTTTRQYNGVFDLNLEWIINFDIALF